MSNDPVPPARKLSLAYRGGSHRRERRAAPRYCCPPATLVLVCLLGQEGHVEGCVQELSRSGIGLELARPLPVGTAAVVRMHARKPHGIQMLAVHVKHATLQVGGTWRVGCAFDEDLDLDTMDALL